jgi:hypothetical protein
LTNITINDRKVKQAEFDSFADPLSSDLIAIFSLLRDEALETVVENSNETPEQIIEKIIGLLR